MSFALAQLPSTAPVEKKDESIPKYKNWKERRTKRLLKISASQLETFDLCNRKWWLDKVRGFGHEGTQSTVFGTVLHSVVERYLRADDLGRDRATLEPVNLYPDKWHIAEGRFGAPSEGEVSVEEQGQIKSLVAAAIQNGTLERLPDRLVEHNFSRTVVKLACSSCNGSGMICKDCGLPCVHTPSGEVCAEGHGGAGKDCPDCKGDGKGTHVMITGLIDLLYPDGIQDHKTAKNIRYIKTDRRESENYLGKNIQMLAYAKEQLMIHADNGWPIPDRLYLRHNQYIKDPAKPRVIKCEVWVTREEIEAAWDRIIATSKEMEALRHKIDRADQISDPPVENRACMAYGGCQFRSICNGQESEQGYQNRLDREDIARNTKPMSLAGRIQLQQTLSEKEPAMSVDFVKKIAMRNAATGNAATPAPATEAAPSATTAPAAAASTAAPSTTTPPATTVAKPLAKKPPAPKVLTKADVQAFIAAEAVKGFMPPPWAIADCTSCSGLGFNTMGSPCKICDHKTQENGNAVSSDFIITPVGDGYVSWTYREDPTLDGGSGKSLSVLPPPPPVKQQEKIQEAPPVRDEAKIKADADAAAKAKEAAAAKAVADKAAADEAAKAAALNTAAADAAGTPGVEGNDAPTDETNAVNRRPGRPQKGFMLMINCSPIRGMQNKNTGRHVYNLNLLLGGICQKIVDAQPDRNVTHFTQLDVFKRRDALSQYAVQVAESFGSDIVVVTGIGRGASDLKTLVEALEQQAGMVVLADGMS